MSQKLAFNDQKWPRNRPKTDIKQGNIRCHAHAKLKKLKVTKTELKIELNWSKKQAQNMQKIY